MTATLLAMISGGGRTIMNLQDCIDRGALDARIGLVVASRECAGVERARARGLEVVVAPGDLAPARIDELRASVDAEWIVLGGYLRLVAITERTRNRVVNIHPALLPRFGGPGMHGRRVHEAVLAAGCEESGCTVHLCDETFDTGPIVLQRVCPVREGDTPETLAERVFKLECEAFPEAISLLIAGKVSIEGRRARIMP